MLHEHFTNSFDTIKRRAQIHPALHGASNWLIGDNLKTQTPYTCKSQNVYALLKAILFLRKNETTACFAICTTNRTTSLGGCARGRPALLANGLYRLATASDVAIAASYCAIRRNHL